MTHRTRQLLLLSLLLLLVALPGTSHSVADEAKERGFLGLQLKQAGSRAEVLSVVPDGPASSIDILPGDFVVAFNGAEFYFDSTVELIKGLKWVTADTPVQLRIDRRGQFHEVVVIPAPLGRDRQVTLDDWISAEELAEQEARRDCAFDEFTEMFRASPIEVTFTRPVGETTVLVDSAVALPSDLDLIEEDPMMRLLVETLKPGDRAKVVYSFKDAMIHQAITEAPAYVEPVFNQYSSTIRGLRDESAERPVVPGKNN